MDWGVALGVFGAVGVPLALIGTGLGVAMAATPSKGEFHLARACFICAALMMASGTFLLQWNYTEGSAAVRIAIVALLGALIFGGLAGALDWINKKQHPIEQAPATRFSWEWDPLTGEQIEKIAAHLRAGSAHSIQLSYHPKIAAALVSSLEQIFDKAGWAHTSVRLAEFDDLNSATGLRQYKESEAGKILKGAIEANTSLRVSSIDLRFAPPSVFVVGWKPAPSPLPDEVKKQFDDLAKQLTSLSKAILDFAEDRNREQALLPSEESYGKNDNGRQAWQRRVDFSTQTEALLSRKFGADIASSLGQLYPLGIQMPFQVRTTGGYHIARIGKWYALLASHLANGQIEEARANAADNNFWFNQ
jgi:hypothetical protein